VLPLCLGREKKSNDEVVIIEFESPDSFNQAVLLYQDKKVCYIILNSPYSTLPDLEFHFILQVG
jgi:hypothetical protein